ncbi:MBL fold metallo-hydrolase [Aliikangiella sp. G2MR2-5]|uniref:MBL fold metallo-hydrolase n=1 Tax=Aliikangiella sp. G2MR2-5 TaxID=2788943 RepID=UPI0018AC31B8|nr:MBL fold metallo-hydrolase [Aliikangiella sp. G2MR2-5]
MKAISIFQKGSHQWLCFGRDPEKVEKIIDTNQYMISSGEQSIILDPGGIELFSQMLTSVLRYTTLDNIKALFASHQDPDIISSLGLWDQCLKNSKLYSPWLWESFIRHFGMNNIQYEPIPDEGSEMTLGNVTLQFIPAHYLHSSGNMHVYDKEAKILMSGDVGAALDEITAPFFVEDFDAHIPKMEYFHRRWMPSNKAKEEWISRVRRLEIDIIAPQHGGIFKGEMVNTFLDWFERLDVGIAKNK